MAVAIDRQGVRLGELHTVATTHGYEELERWSRGLGEIHAFGIEGTGSYGAGVARFLTSRGHTVVEVNRPDRSTRYDLEVGSQPRVRRVPICYLSLTQTGLDLFGFAIVVWRERT